jgi:lysophospholipase L1-like esterase
VDISRRSFLSATLPFLVPLYGGGPERLRSVSALGDSMSDTVFFPTAYPHWLASYLPGVRVFSQGEGGDTTAAVLRRCRPGGIVDYTALARHLGKTARPAAPGQYCSVLAGANDLIYEDDSARQIIDNLTRVYSYLRHQRSTPFPVTILPWASSPRFRPKREAVRITVNEWIRLQPLAINVEHVMGNGRTPPALKPAFNGDDGLHPVGDGPKFLAKAVAVRMLRHARGD